MFLSWGGDHIVFNSATMKVYDQIMSDGTRKEAAPGSSASSI